jgi:hypothetical protein
LEVVAERRRQEEFPKFGRIANQLAGVRLPAVKLNPDIDYGRELRFDDLAVLCLILLKLRKTRKLNK